MAKQHDIYKCPECDCLLEVKGGCTCDCDCEFSCCGNPMEKLVEQTADKAKEKHVPVIEKIAGGYKVTVGTTLHPMTEEHWITLIELITDDKVYTQYLKPGDAPEATFMVDAENVSAREYCNLHGLWRA